MTEDTGKSRERRGWGDAEAAIVRLIEDGGKHGHPPGWYYHDREYPEEGLCGPFHTDQAAARHASQAYPLVLSSHGEVLYSRATDADRKPIDPAYLDRLLWQCAKLAAVGQEHSESGRLALEGLAQVVAQVIGRIIGSPPDELDPRLGFAIVLWQREREQPGAFAFTTHVECVSSEELTKRIGELADVLRAQSKAN